MRKTALLVLVAMLASVVAWCQDVDEGELKSVGEREIVFESYTGGHTVFDTAEEIVGIGRALALSLGADGRRGDFFGLYSVIRAIDPAEKTKLDADIIVFEKNAGVDHIRNVRRIIAGYVETGFGYSRADAELLAIFVTYYNAVYRGKLDELGAKYSAAVMANLSAENAGIALHYREWPGKTRLLIPLARAGALGVPRGEGAGAGTPAATRPPGPLSTTELTEKKVVEQLRSEPDKGLPERKAMVDLKEREVEKAKETIAAEEKKLEERKAEVAKREEAVKAETPAPTASAGTPSPEAKAVAEEKAAIEEAEKKVEEKKEVVEAKEGEIARDREGIVTDEKATPVGPEKPAEPAAKPEVSESVLFLAGRGSPEGGRLVVIDPTKRSTSASSAVGGLAGLDYSYLKESIVVLAREGGVVHLVLLDPKTLEVTARGEDPMYAGSYVHSQSGAVYAVTMDGASARLGRYDEKLARTALSAEVVDKDSYIRIFGDEVYVSGASGTIMVLSATDLQSRGQVQGAAR